MTQWHWGFWQAVALHRRGRARAAAADRLGLPSRRRDRVRDGDARVRAGRLGARVQEPVAADGRRGRLRRRLHEAARLLRRDPEHEEPLLARARLRGVRLRRRALGDQLVAGPRVAGDPRERAAHPGARPADVRLQADVVRARVVPRDAGRDRLPRADQRREPVGDDARLHARAARDGRDRRHRLALGRDDRRARLHVPEPPARRPRRLARGRRRCRRCCARRCRSRSSSSGRCSSSSSTSRRAASRGSAASAARRSRSRRRTYEARLGVAGRRARRCC